MISSEMQSVPSSTNFVRSSLADWQMLPIGSLLAKFSSISVQKDSLRTLQSLHPCKENNCGILTSWFRPDVDSSAVVVYDAAAASKEMHNPDAPEADSLFTQNRLKKGEAYLGATGQYLSDISDKLNSASKTCFVVDALAVHELTPENFRALVKERKTLNPGKPLPYPNGDDPVFLNDQMAVLPDLSDNIGYLYIDGKKMGEAYLKFSPHIAEYSAEDENGWITARTTSEKIAWCILCTYCCENNRRKSYHDHAELSMRHHAVQSIPAEIQNSNESTHEKLPG